MINLMTKVVFVTNIQIAHQANLFEAILSLSHPDQINLGRISDLHTGLTSATSPVAVVSPRIESATNTTTTTTITQLHTTVIEVLAWS